MDSSEDPVQLKGFRSLSVFREKDKPERLIEELRLEKNSAPAGRQQGWHANDASPQSHNVDLEDNIADATSRPKPDKTSRNPKLRELFYLQDGSYAPGALDNQIPSNRFEIVWKDLAYEIEVSRFDCIVKSLMSTKNEREKNSVGKRVIFDNLNGYARSGEITAIIGPSGAGKTTLLNAICGFQTQNHRGSIRLLGGHHKRRMQLSLIPQKDYLLDDLTVYENLSYASRILNVNNGFDHEANISRVVEVLNLTNCVHTRCKNLSGGECKRVSIAQELLRQPDILVLDEPTSGLDSLNCKRLISTLRDLIGAADERGAISPIAIVMTIHQPDVEIYSMFDHIYCLAPGGRVVFDGHPSKTIDILETQGGLDLQSYDEKSQHAEDAPLINPANLLIEIALKDSSHSDHNIDRLAAYQRNQFDRYWKSMGLYQDYVSSLSIESAKGCHERENPKVDSEPSDGGNSSSKHLIRDKRLYFETDHRGLFWHHTSLLTKRSFLGVMRDPLQSLTSFLFHAIVAISMWMIYSKNVSSAHGCPQLVRDISLLSANQDAVQGKFTKMLDGLRYTYEGMAMFFCITYAITVLATEIASMTFPISMHILLKEFRNGRYNLSAFVLAKMTANFPIGAGFPTVCMAFVYWLCDMPDSYMNWRMIAISIVTAVAVMIVVTQGLVIGALFMDNPQAAVFSAIASTLPYVLLSGFLAPIRTLPKILQYASYLNPLRYSSDLIAMIRYGFGICTCEFGTDQYLKTAKYRIVDMPESVNHMFEYYLRNHGIAGEEQIDGKDVQAPVPGISYQLVMNATDEAKALERFESKFSDPFEPLAKLISGMFSFGQSIESCESQRSVLLIMGGIPPDDRAPYLFGLMVTLLSMWIFILFIVVWYKVRSRV